VAITYGSWWRSGIAVAAASRVQGREWLQLVRAFDGDVEMEQEAVDADLIPPHRPLTPTPSPYRRLSISPLLSPPPTHFPLSIPLWPQRGICGFAKRRRQGERGGDMEQGVLRACLCGSRLPRVGRTGYRTKHGQFTSARPVFFWYERIFLTDEEVLVFFTYHGSVTITSSSRIISRDYLYMPQTKHTTNA
jgi:hypothetical protein